MYTIANTYSLPDYAEATLAAQLVNTSAANVGAPMTDLVECVGGNGIFEHAAQIPDNHQGWLRVYEVTSPDIILVSIPINPQEIENSDLKTSVVPAYVWAYANRTLSGAINNITVVSTVNAGIVAVYGKDTWQFSINNSALVLSLYDVVAFVVKRDPTQPDDEALLYVRSDTGLQRIGGAAAAAPSDGELLVDSVTQISVTIDMTATGVWSGTYRWWIKGFKTIATPDEGYTLADGTFRVISPGLQAIA